MQKSKIFIIILCLLAILTISTTFASDDINNIQTNTTDVLSIDNTEIQSSAGDMESQAEENQISAVGSGADDASDKESQTQENQIISDDISNIKTQNNEKLGAVNDGSEDVLSEEGNFEELRNKIYNFFDTGSGDRTLTLDKDYVYTDTNVVEQTFKFPTRYIITIDGDNHTIDFNNKDSGFKFNYQRSTSLSTNIIFKNIHFKNVPSRLFYIGSESGTYNPVVNFNITNCTFTNDNYAGNPTYNNPLIYVGASSNNIFNLNIEGCDFYNLNGNPGRVLQIGSGKVNVKFNYCSFINISASANSAAGGIISAIYGFNDLYISNCNFENIDLDVPGDSKFGAIINAIFQNNPQKTFNLINSTFINCSSTGNGGVILFNRNSIGTAAIDLVANIDNSRFINNYAKKNGGVISIASEKNDGNYNFNLVINIKNNSSFINNSAGVNGGVISYQHGSASNTDNVNINIENDCSFTKNHADSNGGVISFNDNKKLKNSITISDNCYFKDNYVQRGNGGVIYTVAGNININNASFVNNSVKTTSSNSNNGGGAIYISGDSTRSNLIISNSSFTNNHLDGGNLNGGAINVGGATNTNIENTVFSDNIATFTGSAVHLNSGSSYTTNNNFKNVTFENNLVNAPNRIDAGGAVSIIFNLYNDFEDCKFINNTVDSSGGRGGAIYLMRSSDSRYPYTKIFKNITFKDNSATHGGAVYVSTPWRDIQITDCNFTNNSANEFGGAVYIDRTDINIDNSDFIENSANMSGGAVYLDDGYLRVDNSDFEKNSAVRSGGAIYLNEGDAIVNIDNSNFINNSAENIYGGAIFAGISTYTTIDHSTFTFNSAYQGSAINYQAETGVESSHSISNSIFTDNNANSTQLILTADALKNTLEIIYFGGNNYIDAIKSYDNVEFSNVTYHSYDKGITTTIDGNDLEHKYTVAEQLIHAEFLDENNNILYTKDLVTDENGRNLTDIPDDSRITSIRAYRDGDPYYKAVYSNVEFGLGDFDLLQRQITATGENGILDLLMNYTYTLNLDTITEGIEITKPITINGHGNTINALYKSRVFKILTNNVKFINITFVNSTKWDGSFIYGQDVENIEIDYCRFENSKNIFETSQSQSEDFDPDEDRIHLISECDGGAVYILGRNTLTNNSEFINLLGLHGGAMYLEGLNHTIANSYFNHTHAVLAGGAVFALGQDYKILNSVFENCFADSEKFEEDDVDRYIAERMPVNDGGLIPVGPPPFIDIGFNSFGNDILGSEDGLNYGDEVVEEIANPFINRGGGAIYFACFPENSDTLTIYNSNFTNCTTNSFGGAIYSGGSYTNITYSNFILSKAVSGGAIFFDISATNSNVYNSTFFNNTAEANGGAISWYANRGILSDSQFINNTQRTKNPGILNGGGAIYWFGNDADIINVNFTNNRVSFPFDNWDYMESSGNPYITTYDQLKDQWREDDFTRRYSKGGALLIRGKNIHIADSLFKQNYAQSGGAMAVEFFEIYSELPDIDPIPGGDLVSDKSIGMDMLGDSGTGLEFDPGIEFDPGWILPPILPSFIVMVENTKFIDNFAQYGGAVSVEFELPVSGESNTDEDALNTEVSYPPYYNAYNNEENLFINCEFYNNTAYLAGALYLNADRCTVDNSIFEDNAAIFGGAIFNGKIGRYEKAFYVEYYDEWGNLVQDIDYKTVDTFVTGNFNQISNSTFKHNYALYAGAVFWLGDDGQILGNSHFIENGYADTFDRYCEDVYNCYQIEVTPDNYYDINWNVETDEETGVSQAVIQMEGMPIEIYEGKGGAIVWYGSYGIIENSEFIQNYAVDGGAIFAKDLLKSSDTEEEYYFLNIIESYFENNSAALGGAISVYDGNGTIAYSKFINNTATLNIEPGFYDLSYYSLEPVNEGGAIFWNGLDAFITFCDFINNTANNGGAIYIRTNDFGYGDNSHIENCTFENNSAVNGGAIYNEAKYIKISGIFIANTATQNGGAIYNKGNGVNVLDSTFRYNKADGGSAIYDMSDEMDIGYSIFEQNKASSLSITISSIEAGEDKTVIIDAIFKGNDNLMNALYVRNMPLLNRVEYWGADGLTNTMENYPFISYPEAGINITFRLISEEDPSIYHTQVATTNLYGNVVATIPNVKTGRYYAIVSHLDDFYYTEINALTWINVGKVESQIQIEIEDISYKQNESTNITLNSDVTGNVTVQIDGENYTTVDLTGKNGVITLENISDLEAGVHNITVIYSGDSQYENSSKTVKFTVRQIPSTVNITTNGGYYKEDIAVNVTVENDAKGKVIVTIEDQFGSTIIINNTNKLHTIINTLNVGTYNVTAHYLGDNNYLPSNNQTTLVVKPINLKPVVTATDVTIAENTTFIIIVPDDFVGNVSIGVDGIIKDYEIAGSTQITFVNLNAGNKSAYMRFYGDNNYNETTLYPVNFTVTENLVIKPVYTITINIPDTIFLINTTAVVNVSNNISGSAVIFIGDNEFPVNIVNGTGSVDINGLAAGVKTATVNFTSTDKSINLTASTKFAINKAQSNVNITVEGETVKVNITDGATGTVDVYINGVKEVFNYNGTVIVCENTLIIGNNTIVAVYEGNENYTESQNDKEWQIAKKSSHVNVTADPITYGGDALIIVRVGEEQTGHVTITINNENYTAEIKNNSAIFSIPGLNATDYLVTVKYSGDRNYAAETNDTTLTVNKADLPASVEGRNATVSDNTLFILSNVPDDFNGLVNITVDGIAYSGAPKSLIEMSKLTAGDKTANVVFYGDNNYNDLPLTVNFTVTKPTETATAITVTVPDVTYPGAATAIINVSGYANGTVIVTVNGEKYEAQSVVNGQATVDLGILSAGVKNITAEFIVSETDLINTNATTSSKFMVNKADSKVELTANDKNITINVIGGNGKVMLYINGVKQEINFTGSAITLNDALNIGNNTVLAIYEGNENYTGSQNNTEAEILKNKATVNVTADAITYSADAVIVVSVGENQKGYVTITVNNQEYTSEINGNQIIFNVPGLNATTYPVTVKYSGDDNYGSEINDTTLTVNKADLPASVEGHNATVRDNTLFILSNVPDDFNGLVNITVDGIAYSGAPKSLIEMSKLTAGDKTANVVFYGDNNYNDLPLSVNFTVSRITATPTTMTVTVSDVTYPGVATAIINVSGYANGTVIVTVNGEKYEAQSVVNGQATVDLGILSAGVKNITAAFSVGETDLINTNATAANKFVVEKAQSNIKVSVQDEKIIINVTDGSSANVTVYVNGVKQDKLYAGEIIIIEDALSVGDNTVLAIYEGNENYTRSQDSTKYNITKRESFVNANQTEIVYGSDAIVTVNVPIDQKGYVTILVNNQNLTQEIKDGKAVFTISGLAVNEYPVSINYLGDTTFDSQVNTTLIKVVKADLTAGVIGQNITVVQNSEFIITVPDDFTGKVNITVDGFTYSGDVKSLITMDKLTAGNKTATVVFWSDPNYNDLTLNAEFTVSQLPVHMDAVTVNVDNMTRGYNSQFDYQASFLDSNGNALANADVEFKVDGKTYKVKTNKDGIAHLTESKLDVGVYNITSVNLVTGEEATAQLTIVARIIQNKDLTMDFSSGKSFVVKVIGDDGNIAPEGEIIDIYINTIHYVAKVNKKGYAKLKINLNPRKYSIVAEYKTFKTSNKLVVKQVLKLVKKTVSAKKGKKVVLQAKLKWSNGKAIKGKNIVFKFKGKKYKAKTNSKGVAKVTIKAKVTKKLKKGKKYTFTASYKTNKVKGKIKVKK